MPKEKIKPEGKKAEDHDFCGQRRGDDMRDDQKNQKGNPDYPVAGSSGRFIFRFGFHFFP
jgi:hypothetical protein